MLGDDDDGPRATAVDVLHERTRSCVYDERGTGMKKTLKTE